MGVESQIGREVRVPNERTAAKLPPTLVWIESFEIGVPELDADHRQLIDDARAIEDAIRGGRSWPEVEAAADTMALHCSAHFRREEAVLERDSFGKHASHKIEHQRIEAEMLRVLDRIRGADPPTPDMIEAALYFRGMLVDHLLHYDLAYKSHVLDRRGR
jgi:hemerythrin